MKGEHLPADAGVRVAKVAVPVGLEFILVLGLTFINQIVVGGLGDTAVAAVGFANSIHTIPLFFFGALQVGAGVVVARAYGGMHKNRISTSVTLAVILALSLSLLAAIPFVLYPEEILGLAGASTEVRTVGADYMAVLVSGLFAGVLGMVLASVLRSSNRPRSPMVATIIMVMLNIPLAIILVYGWGPIPALGVVGAGIATLITTVIRAVILMVQTFIVFDVADWSVPRSLKEWGTIGRPVVVLAVPMALTSLSWTFGNFFYNVAVQQLGDGPLAALQIVFAMSGIFVVGSIGLGSAVTVLVGQSVGAGNPAQAKEWVDYILKIGLITGVTFGTLFALSSFALPSLFPNVSPDVIAAATAGIFITAALQPVVVRMLLFAAILPSGNDTTGIIIGDFAGPYLVGLPLTLLLAFFTPLGVIGAFVGRGGEEIVKWLVFASRGHRITWDSVVQKHEASLITHGDPRTGPISVV
jgi:putative MATE family efflux protein